eukprot:scaffold15874_cov150-Isochrysis_galbana.AAC.4
MLQEHPLDLSRIELPELLPHHVIGACTTGWHLAHDGVAAITHRSTSAAAYAYPSSPGALAVRAPLSDRSRERRIYPQCAQPQPVPDAELCAVSNSTSLLCSNSHVTPVPASYLYLECDVAPAIACRLCTPQPQSCEPIEEIGDGETVAARELGPSESTVTSPASRDICCAHFATFDV